MNRVIASRRAIVSLMGTLWLIASLTTPVMAHEAPTRTPPTTDAHTTPEADPRTITATNTRDITDDEISTAMDLLMQARTREAMAYLDSLEVFCAGQPLFMLTRGRMLLELIPIR
jgi:hypothetical protein